jgi:hypothetical protein
MFSRVGSAMVHLSILDHIRLTYIYLNISHFTDIAIIIIRLRVHFMRRLNKTHVCIF